MIFTLNLLGHTLCLALPAAAAAASPLWLYGCLTAIGVAQGPMIPVQGALKANWLAQGPGRAWALRIIGLGGRVAGPVIRTMIAGIWLAFFSGWQRC